MAEIIKGLALLGPELEKYVRTKVKKDIKTKIKCKTLKANVGVKKTPPG